MKAAVVTGPGQIPKYGDFEEPRPGQGKEVITVKAAALTNATRSRASGSHNSASGVYPLVAGVDGVGQTVRGERVFFVLPDAPFGSMAQQTVVARELCIPLPEGLDDITAAALGNPGMSSMAALKFRARLRQGETVLVNGATGVAGRLAVQIARYLGARRVVAVGRDAAVLESLKRSGADATVSLTLDEKDLSGAFEELFRGEGIDVVLDYVFGRSAELLLRAAATSMDESKSLRYVEVGGASGQPVTLQPPVLRAKPIVLMGSGFGSLPITELLEATTDVFNAALPARLTVATRVIPLANVEEAWSADAGRERVVFQV